MEQLFIWFLKCKIFKVLINKYPKNYSFNFVIFVGHGPKVKQKYVWIKPTTGD